MNRTEALLKRVTEEFRETPRVEYFGPERWRVGLHDYHVHHNTSSGSCGSFCAYGRSVPEAARRLLKIATENVVIQGQFCGRGCPHYSIGLDD